MNPFAYKVRVRVCGILKEHGKILMIRHEGIGKSSHLWAPPGGGVEFGDNMQVSLKKEFLEETNLNVEVTEYLFASEHIDSKHHSVEHFFKVKRISGNLTLGIDPELPKSKQIISAVKFFTPDDLNEIDSDCIHSAFLLPKTRDKIDDLRGLITFKY